MSFQDIIESEIRREAQKLATRYQRYHNNLYLVHQRNIARVSNAPEREVRIPPHWENSRLFNPFYVLKHSKSIAHSITTKLRNRTYQPHVPIIRQITKPSGGTRSIRVYEIPDAALSHYIYKRLLNKNKHRFSSFSYAYREDKNVHFAIQDIAVDLGYYSRLFIAEFDFSDFFGSIRHDYLFDQFNKNGFSVNEDEEFIMRRFLTQYGSVGVPQGTSISLFLANLACWKLDKKLEAIGIKFARYADDSVVWTNDYSRVCQAFEIFHSFSIETGVSINLRKSDGINLLLKEGLKSEFGIPKTHFSFLGYKLSVGRVSVSDKAISKIKKQISYLLYRNLIQPLLGEQLRALIIPSNNEDPGFLVGISQVRRYLYGNLSESYLAGYLRGVHSTIIFKGIMSFYPLVNDEDQLKSLDGWLVGVIYRCLCKRARLLRQRNYNRDNQFPFNVRKNELLDRCQGLLTIPSFLRIYQAIQRGILAEGIEGVVQSADDPYGYQNEI